VRLDQSFDRFNRELRRRHGITGAQLAMLRILAEREPVTLARLRAELAMHPATLGQLIERIARAGLVVRAPDPDDRRRRVLRVTTRGWALLVKAPLAGPVRLRTARLDPDRLVRLAEAFEDAVVLFGMEEWAA